jgi:hypothetical protein
MGTAKTLDSGLRRNDEQKSTVHATGERREASGERREARGEKRENSLTPDPSPIAMGEGSPVSLLASRFSLLASRS